ncbi:hypothetical protein ACW6AV_002349 [Edwardsiella piscicida]|uniref:hypothetical protein n=1 Tax=Edwardsiella piscicida TaxID=1263550 RepID=UPI00101AB79B|nr:hypothetical protein [Edwardsiella piscicida]ELM3734805.1 hypothetical protein [Edwardsiella piscicida]QBB14233.1 hypothetical protein EVK84_17625 [Edwardsiella piscicida]WGS78523.1 hypothetical protein PED68_07740 [Edwardsiella piscicida]WGS81908.1 hypothetical protein PED70_07745 [Edwardsiella piscicida]
MSGKKTKAEAQQGTENSVASTPSAEMASLDVQNGQGHEPAVPTPPDDVIVLEVHAVPERGFYRCGRFWPHEPVHVFVSDDPDADKAANQEAGEMVDCFVSHADAARLQAEPMLVVSVLDKVVENA